MKDAVLEGELNVLSVRCGLCWGTGVKDTSLKVEEENDPSRLLGLAENSEGPGLLRTAVSYTHLTLPTSIVV